MSELSNPEKLKATLIEKSIGVALSAVPTLLLLIVGPMLGINKWSDITEMLGPATALSVLGVLIWSTMLFVTVCLRWRTRWWLVPFCLWALFQGSIFALDARGIDLNKVMGARPKSKDEETRRLGDASSKSKEADLASQNKVKREEPTSTPPLVETKKVASSEPPPKPSPPPLEKVPYEGKDTKSLSIEDN